MQRGKWIVMLAVPVYMASIFASIPLLAARPIAPITTLSFVLVGVGALVSIAVWPRAYPRPQRLHRLLTVAVLTPLGLVVVVAMLSCACIKIPMWVNEQTTRAYLAARQDGAAPDQEPTDTYGGRFHHEGDGPGARIWSDGPDSKDGGGKVSVVQSVRSFEAAWQTNYGHSFLDTIQNGIRRLAFAELLEVWGCMQGDIVWRIRPDGKVTAVE